MAIRKKKVCVCVYVCGQESFKIILLGPCLKDKYDWLKSTSTILTLILGEGRERVEGGGKGEGAEKVVEVVAAVIFV